MEFDEPFNSIFAEKFPGIFLSKLQKVHAFCSSTNCSENFYKFLESHASSIREIYVDFEKCPTELSETIFMKMEKLEKVTIGKSTLPAEQQFYETLKPIESLTELIIRDGFETENAAKGILKNCPNLKTFKIFKPKLEMYDSLAWLLPSLLAKHNQQIESLSIPFLNIECDKEILRNLKVFEVDVIKQEKSLLAFMCQNMSIETLSIQCDEISDNFYEVLSKYPSLKNLKIESSIENMQNIFDKIKTINIKSLELRFLFQGAKCKTLIKLPTNQINWHPKEVSGLDFESFQTKI